MPEDLCACDQREPIRGLTSTIVASKRTGLACGKQAPDMAPDPVDLDAWRAEAGAALEVVAHYPRYPMKEDVSALASAARTGWPRDAARVGVLCERVRALEARVAAWRKLAFTINTRRLSDGVDDDAAALEEAHHRAWAEVQRVDPAGARRREAGAAAGCEVVLVVGREESK